MPTAPPPADPRPAGPAADPAWTRTAARRCRSAGCGGSRARPARPDPSPPPPRRSPAGRSIRTPPPRPAPTPASPASAGSAAACADRPAGPPAPPAAPPAPAARQPPPDGSGQPPSAMMHTRARPFWGSSGRRHPDDQQGPCPQIKHIRPYKIPCRGRFPPALPANAHAPSRSPGAGYPAANRPGAAKPPGHQITHSHSDFDESLPMRWALGPLVAAAVSIAVYSSSAIPSHLAWESSDPFGAWNNGGFIIYNNEWNPSAGPQTIWADSYGYWGVQSDQPGDNAAVETYPCVQKDYSNVTAVVDRDLGCVAAVHSRRCVASAPRWPGTLVTDGRRSGKAGAAAVIMPVCGTEQSHDSRWRHGRPWRACRAAR